MVPAVLFRDDGFHKVPRMVDVVSFFCRDVIREQLQRNHLQNRQQQFRSARHIKDVLRDAFNLCVSFGGNRDELPTPRTYFSHHIERPAIAKQ